MSITQQVQVAADFEAWRLERVQLGEPFDIEDYERHLLNVQNGNRLRSIHGIAVSGADDDSPLVLLHKLQQIADLSAAEEETA